jgi:hypothetical protein
MTDLMERRTEGSRAASRRPGRGAVLVAATCALLVGTAGVVLAIGLPRGSDGAPAPAPRATAPAAVPTTNVPTAAPTPKSGATARPPAPSASPADPYALSDGTYPTYVRSVDVAAGTITVDVVQLFKHADAFHAAVQDGIRHHEARYLTVYIRNENPLLRTLPVARDVTIHFIGSCDTPPNRHVALTQLRDAIGTGDDTTFYYAVSLSGGEVSWVSQHLAVPAC